MLRPVGGASGQTTESVRVDRHCLSSCGIFAVHRPLHVFERVAQSFDLADPIEVRHTVRQAHVGQDFDRKERIAPTDGVDRRSNSKMLSFQRILPRI